MCTIVVEYELVIDKSLFVSKFIIFATEGACGLCVRKFFRGSTCVTVYIHTAAATLDFVSMSQIISIPNCWSTNISNSIRKPLLRLSAACLHLAKSNLWHRPSFGILYVQVFTDIGVIAIVSIAPHIYKSFIICENT